MTHVNDIQYLGIFMFAKNPCQKKELVVLNVK